MSITICNDSVAAIVRGYAVDRVLLNHTIEAVLKPVEEHFAPQKAL